MNYIFDVIALDSDFNIVAVLSYTNLQWTRKYYKSGTFSIQIPIKQYDTSFRYVYTKDRPEVGEISQINFIDERNISLSGYFLEEKLNRRVCYAMPSITNIKNNPSWLSQKGSAEDVAISFFNAFNDLEFEQNGNIISCKLNIESHDSKGRGDIVEHTRDNTQLGDKIHDILKPSLMSYKVEYNLEENKETFMVVKGLDCTQGNKYGNNPVIFSTTYGNLLNPNVVISSTNYKNAYLTYTKSEKDGIIVVEAKSERKKEDTSERFISISTSDNRSNYSSDEEFVAAINVTAHNELTKYPITLSYDFDTAISSYEYMKDFDIGYKCSIDIPAIGLHEDAVLVECAEVIKAGVWSMSMEFET